MITSITRSILLEYLCGQLNTFFPDKKSVSPPDLKSAVSTSLDRLEYCFSHINDKYYQLNKDVHFNHLHSDQYAAFLYFVSRNVYLMGKNNQVAEKLFLLNKLLNGLDCFYTVELPSIFLFVHPLGTVLGNGAVYSDYLLISQNCTVGDNYDGQYPVFSEGVALYANAKIIGGCKVGRNCFFASDSFIYKTDIPQNSLVFGKHPDVKCTRHNKSVIEKHFKNAE